MWKEEEEEESHPQHIVIERGFPNGSTSGEGHLKSPEQIASGIIDSPRVPLDLPSS